MNELLHPDPNLYLARKISKKLAADPNAKLSNHAIMNILLDESFYEQRVRIIKAKELEMKLFRLYDDQVDIKIGVNRISYREYKKAFIYGRGERFN